MIDLFTKTHEVPSNSENIYKLYNNYFEFQKHYNSSISSPDYKKEVGGGDPYYDLAKIFNSIIGTTPSTSPTKEDELNNFSKKAQNKVIGIANMTTKLVNLFSNNYRDPINPNKISLPTKTTRNI